MRHTLLSPRAIISATVRVTRTGVMAMSGAATPLSAHMASTARGFRLILSLPVSAATATRSSSSAPRLPTGLAISFSRARARRAAPSSGGRIRSFIAQKSMPFLSISFSVSSIPRNRPFVNRRFLLCRDALKKGRARQDSAGGEILSIKKEYQRFFMVREMRPVLGSTFRTVTFTTSPTRTTSEGWRMKRSASWEIWTRPS